MLLVGGGTSVRVNLHQPFGPERAQLIDQAGSALYEARSYEATVRIAAGCTVPALADLAVIVVNGEGREERIEVAHADTRREPLVREMLARSMDRIRQVATREVKTGRQFRWIPSVSKSAIRFVTRTDPTLSELFEALDVRSLIVVPLRTGRRLLGAMALARSAEHEPYHAADLAVAQVIARKAAVAIDNAELHQRTQEETGRRSRLEDALQKWIRVFDVAGWGAAIVDAADLRMDAVNPAFARIHGYPHPESLIGQLFTTLLIPDRCNETDRWATLNDRSEAYESVHLRADGTSFPVLTDVTALEMGAGAASYVVTVQDITELKRAEERLRRAQRMEAVGRLAGGMAHEVNNMMTIILGFGDLLAGAADLPAGRQGEIEEIRKAAIRTARITQQLLAFSRQQILQPAELQLGEVVGEMAAVMRHLLPANIRVETVLSPVAVDVHADRAQLDQVLINLAFNARDAMPMGGTLRLETGSRRFEAEDGMSLIGIPVVPGQYAVLSVSDTGHGMDPGTLGQVFEPFFTTKTMGAGTGLGLATVYGIVKQSGGFVWADSTPGIGTTFTVCLPELPRRAEVPQEQITLEGSGRPRGSATILVIEDEDGVRELARRVLQEEGYTVQDVRSGAEAVDLLDTAGSEIDLVLSDVIVPDMATVQLEEQILERRPRLPIVYMSGYSRDELVDRGLVPAERPFIQKPFTGAELVDVVGSELDIAEARGGPVTI
jgi:two-component system cell cycle sensor histidine kinase/response regulator CckA